MTNNVGESVAWRAISLLSLHQAIVWKECVCVCVYMLEPCPKASAFSASPGALLWEGALRSCTFPSCTQTWSPTLALSFQPDEETDPVQIIFKIMFSELLELTNPSTFLGQIKGEQPSQ